MLHTRRRLFVHRTGVFKACGKTEAVLYIDRILTDAGYKVAAKIVLPDEQQMLSQAMAKIADEQTASLIITTGGTGLAPRDVTPEATAAVLDRTVPGIPEAMRAESMKITPLGMLSRGIAGTRKQTLIVNLPGSPKAVQEILPYILPALEHALRMLTGGRKDCAAAGVDIAGKCPECKENNGKPLKTSVF